MESRGGGVFRKTTPPLALFQIYQNLLFKSVHMYIFLQTTDLDASFKQYFIVVRPLFIAEMPFEAQTS